MKESEDLWILGSNLRIEERSARSSDPQILRSSNP
jgi:hypothetical protein